MSLAQAVTAKTGNRSSTTPDDSKILSEITVESLKSSSWRLSSHLSNGKLVISVDNLAPKKKIEYFELSKCEDQATITIRIGFIDVEFCRSYSNIPSLSKYQLQMSGTYISIQTNIENTKEIVHSIGHFEQAKPMDFIIIDKLLGIIESAKNLSPAVPINRPVP